MSDQKFLGFHRFKMEDTGEEYGSFEIFRRLRLFKEDRAFLKTEPLWKTDGIGSRDSPVAYQTRNPSAPSTPRRKHTLTHKN